MFSAFVLRRVIATLIALLLLVATPAANEISRQLEREFIHLENKPIGSDPQAELRLADNLNENSPEAIILYQSTHSITRKKRLLGLMALTGNADFLVVVHEALTQQTELAEPALAVALSLNQPGSAAYVNPYLKSEKPELVVGALRYFRLFPKKGDRSAILARSDDRNPYIRTAALRVLGYFSDPDSLQICMKHLGEKDLMSRKAAVGCVGREGNKSGLKRLEPLFSAEKEPVQLEIIRVFSAGRGNYSRKILEQWLLHHNLQIALASLIALQERRARETVLALIRLVKKGGSPIPAGILIKSIGLYRQPDSLDFLGNLLLKSKNPDLKATLIEAVGDIGLLEGQRYLLPFLSDYDLKLREAAKQALRKIAISQQKS